MNIFRIAWKIVCQRRLASGLTALNVALGVMLMVLVITIFGAVKNSFNQKSIAYHLLVGAKGSKLQLVLSSVFRIQPPIANLPYMYLDELKKDPRITEAIPLAFGDFTKPEHGSFPIVGTTSEYFQNEYTSGKFFEVEDQEGSRQLSKLYDAVIGAQVAYRNGWKVGDTFNIVHGRADSDKIHTENFEVVAVLKPTGTPNDRSVFLNLEAVYTLDGHQKPVDEVEEQLRAFYGGTPEKLEPALKQLDELRKVRAKGQATGNPEAGYGIDTPPAMKEITAVYIKTRGILDAFKISQEADKASPVMAVNPVKQIAKLMNGVIGNVEYALVALAAVIVVVSGISIFVSIYNSMSDRAKEIGIMRALGAKRTSVFSIILAESALLCVGGGFVGWLVGHGLSIVTAPTIARMTGLLLDPWTLNKYEFILFPVLLLLGVIVGFLPAMTAYRTDVADALNG